MIIYFLLFLVTCLMCKAVEKSKQVELSPSKEKENRAALWLGIIAYLPTIIIMGLRSEIADTDNYVEAFNSINPTGVFDNLAERNPLFTILQNFFKLYISQTADMWLLFITVASVLLMLISMCKYSPMFAISAVVFYGSTEVSYLFNGARQFFAISIMFFAFRFIEEKKLIKYALCCAAAFFIHQTAIIVIPAYFVVRGKFLNFKIILTFLATLAATAFSAMFIDYLNELFISDSVYAHYYDLLVETAGVNIFRVLVAAVPVALCLVYKARIDELEDNSLNISANMSVLALAVSVFSATSGGSLLGRLAEYYLIYNTITYPMLLKRVVSKNVYHIILAGLIIGYIAFFTYQFYVVWDSAGYQSDLLGIKVGVSE